MILELESSSRWETFFTENFHLIENIHLDENEIVSIGIDYYELAHFDNDFANALLEQPQFFANANKIVQDMKKANGDECNVDVYFSSVPTDLKKKIREIRDSDIGKVMSIEGLVTIASEIVPRIIEASFLCICGHETRVVQRSIDELTEPSICEEMEGGCGKKKRDQTMIYDPHSSQRIDFQSLTLQDSPDEAQASINSSLSIHLEEHLVNSQIGGQSVKIIGIPTIDTAWKRNKKSSITKIVFKAKHVEFVEKKLDSLELDQVVIDQIKQESKKSGLMTNLIKSFAPSIYGMQPQKESILLSLVGGVRKELSDGTNRRGSIHLLIMGDPGVAKSQLLDFASKTSPRGKFATGSSTSGVGLTAATAQDKVTDRWYLKAGVMVASDGGHACIDEFDKMREDDRGQMHDAMERQLVHINKAGISAKLNTRCSVIAAANPKRSTFDLNTDYFDQINLSPTIISRFDLIWLITDSVDSDLDRRIASHMLNGKNLKESPYSFDFLRSYVAYASKFEPIIPDDVKSTIIDNYVANRRQTDCGKMTITHRSLEALQRLTEASAKLHLRDEATIEDAERAIRLVKQYVMEVIE